MVVPSRFKYPLGKVLPIFENCFRGVIDLIKMKLLTFSDEGKTMQVAEIPEDLQVEAEVARTELLEVLYEFSDEMMEKAFADEPIPASLIEKVIREATLQRMIQPVVCGSALHGVGVQGVLDCVRDYLPSPLERPPVEGVNPQKPEQPETRKPDVKEPMCGLVFKILPAKTGDFYWVRVYSGELKANTRVACPGQGKKENVAQLWQIHATKKETQIESVTAGDIVGVIGPRNAVTGDTLCDQKAMIQLESIEFPNTVIEMAIEPESTIATSITVLGNSIDSSWIMAF